MAEKKVFFVSESRCFEEKLVQYEYFSGFAVSQKQKSIRSLHEAIKRQYGDIKVLEISTKSEQELGVRCSAFNLMFDYEGVGCRHLENVFQSSKKYTNGGPYRDLLNVAPKDAKRDERLQTSGDLIGFELYGELWPLEPKTMFYDWIYITALKDQRELASGLLEYDCFTDIEFNHKKSINCQARSAAIYVSLCRLGVLEEKTKSLAAFKTIYGIEETELEQLSMF